MVSAKTELLLFFCLRLNNKDRIPVSVAEHAGFDFMLQSVYLVVKPITGCNFSFQFNCTTVDQVVT